VSENRVLRRIFETTNEKVAGGWRRLLNEERHNLYASPNVIRVIKSGRIRWAGHVPRMEEMRNAFLNGRYHLEDLGLDRKIILERILGK
jgi:hypothetical protein